MTNAQYFASQVDSPYRAQAQQYVNSIDVEYAQAKALYDQTVATFKDVNRSSNPAVLADALTQMYKTTKTLSDALKDSVSLWQFYQDRMNEKKNAPIAVSTTQLNSLTSYATKSNTAVALLSSAQRSMQDAQHSVAMANQSLIEKKLQLKKLIDGPNTLDIRSAQLSVQQKQYAVDDALLALANYTIRAPYDGVITGTKSKIGDQIATSTTIANIITKQKTVTLSLNEIDVSQVAIGDPVALTFSALSDVRLEGTVSTVQLTGTASQGVVTYEVAVAFDAKDDRIKSGMSVTAVITTSTTSGVIRVPNSAVKSNRDGTFYVLVADVAGAAYTRQELSAGVPLVTPPKQVQVVVGDSNDSMTEILTGIDEAQYIITRTIQPNTAKPTSTTSALSFGGQGQGGAARALSGGSSFGGGRRDN